MSRGDYERLGVLLREREIECQQLRAAHEATKAELARALNIRTGIDAPEMNDRQAAVAWMKRAEAVEARVAELEAIKPLLDGEVIDQARGLLLEAHHYQNRMPRDFVQRNAAWLRAHPALATPARSCPRCGGIITQQTHVCPATATPEREHPEAHAIRQQIVDESLRTLGIHMPSTTLKPLALTEDRTPEQLEADGDNGVCWGCGEEDCACGAERAEQEGA